jgi:hypothetical protein
MLKEENAFELRLREAHKRTASPILSGEAVFVSEICCEIRTLSFAVFVSK